MEFVVKYVVNGFILKQCADLDKKYKNHPLIKMEIIKYCCRKCKKVDLTRLNDYATTKNIEEKLDSLQTTSDAVAMMMQAASQKLIK